MKTLHLYLIAMAATLAGCSSEEAVVPASDDVGNDDICFTTDVDSRAVCIDNASSLQDNGFWVKALRVDGTPLWPNTDKGDMLHFKYDASTSKFVPEVPEGSTFSAKWPTGQTVFLYASNIDPSEKQLTKRAASDVPAGQDADPDYGGQMYTEINKQSSDVTQHKDYVYATNYGMRKDFTNGTIPLHFKHMFCQVEVQAKNSNPAYTVKVKGYRLHFIDEKASFLFPTPTVNATTSALAATEPDGEWINKTLIGSYYFDFDSGYKNGLTVSDGVYDDNEDNHFTLTSEPQKISNGTDDGHAMIIPWGNFSATKQTGACIYLIVQIDYNDYNNGDISDTTNKKKTPLFPACQVTTDEMEKNLSTRVTYADGLPKYYGRVYVPYSFSGAWDNYAGKKLTLLLDFSNGLGWVDRHKPVPVDPDAEGYDATTATVTENSAAVLTHSVDPYSAYDTVLGDGIGVTATVSAWTSISDITPSTTN